jgi:hypothetical protein
MKICVECKFYFFNVILDSPSLFGINEAPHRCRRPKIQKRNPVTGELMGLPHIDERCANENKKGDCKFFKLSKKNKKIEAIGGLSDPGGAK